METSQSYQIQPTVETIFRDDVAAKRHNYFGKWHIRPTGYVRLNAQLPKGVSRYLHRAIVAHMIANPSPLLAHSKVPDQYDVHHQDGNRLHNCSCNFVILDKALHAGTGNRKGRCPYTGKYLTPAEYERRFGRQEDDEVPF